MANTLTKSKSTHQSIETYNDETGNQRDVSVKVEIDYERKEYSVLPYYHSDGDNFRFVKSSKNKLEYHKAILRAIEKAVEFANAELFPSNT